MASYLFADTGPLIGLAKAGLLDTLLPSNNGGRPAPLAEIEVFPSAIKLSCLVQDFVFPRNSLIRLTKWRGPFYIGLRIRHSVPFYPRFIVFWLCPFFRKARFEQFKSRLEALGYEVNE